MVRTSAADIVELGSILELGLTKDFRKLIFTAFLLGFSMKRDSVEKKPVSLLVVSLGTALSGIPPGLKGRQPAILNRTDAYMQ